MNFRFKWIGAHIDDVDPVAAQTGQDELISGLSSVPETTGACVPSAVVEFVANMRHVQNVDHFNSEKEREMWNRFLFMISL